LSGEQKEKGVIKSYISGFFRAALVALLVLIQFFLIILLTLWLRVFSVYFYILLVISSLSVIINLLNDKRGISYKVSWIYVISLLPLTGHIMFWLWGRNNPSRLDKTIMEKQKHGAGFLTFCFDTVEQFEKAYPIKSRMVRYLESQGFPLYKNNDVIYYPTGEDVFEAIFGDIGKAERFVMINFFIVGEGVLWDKVHALLLRKLSEGVRIMFMYDDFGAMLRTEKAFKRKLEDEGMEVRVFNPIHKYTDKLYMNYRSHQKIIVIDGNVGYTGGMNLADEYVNLVTRFGVWKDNAVRICGDAVWGLTVTFLQMWDVCGNTQTDYNPYRPTVEHIENEVYCQVVADGPANNPINPIIGIYKQIIHYAKKYVYITTPYLIIEDDIRNVLITAKKSGVDVRIITPGIPDKKVVSLLTNYNYGRLLEEGIKIYEYTPGFLHAKTIINEDCGIVGTINMDFRSFYLHYECGLFMCNKESVQPIADDLHLTMQNSRELSYNEWKRRPFGTKVRQGFLNMFATLM